MNRRADACKNLLIQPRFVIISCDLKEILKLPAGRDGNLWIARPSAGSRKHRHAELELNLIRRGSGSYLLDDRRYELNRGSLVWLFPEQNHMLLDFTTEFETWVLVFRPEMVRRACTTPSTRTLRAGRPAGHFCKQLPETESRRLDMLFHEAAASLEEAAQFNAGLAYAMLRAWATHQATTVVTENTEVHPVVEKAVAIMRHETDPLTLDELGRRAGLSASHLSRIFKEQTGISITSLRNRLRLERFVTLYGEGRRRTILEAAFEAGFGSYAQFYRIFTQAMGKTPAAYRRDRLGGEVFRCP